MRLLTFAPQGRDGNPRLGALANDNVKPGDVVECGIDGMMTLRTRIVPPI